MPTDDGAPVPAAEDDLADLSPVMRALVRTLKAGHAHRLCAMETGHQLHLAALSVVHVIASSINKKLDAHEILASCDSAINLMEDRARDQEAALKLAELEWQTAFEELGRRIESLVEAAAS